MSRIVVILTALHFRWFLFCISVMQLFIWHQFVCLFSLTEATWVLFYCFHPDILGGISNIFSYKINFLQSNFQIYVLRKSNAVAFDAIRQKIIYFKDRVWTENSLKFYVENQQSFAFTIFFSQPPVEAVTIVCPQITGNNQEVVGSIHFLSHFPDGGWALGKLQITSCVLSLLGRAGVTESWYEHQKKKKTWVIHSSKAQWTFP